MCVSKKEKESLEQDSNFMIKVATFIVDRRNLFFLLFGILIIFSVVAMGWVKVENSLSAYLPDTTETSQGLDLMEEQFITYGSAKVMVANITYDEAQDIADESRQEMMSLCWILTVRRIISIISRRCILLHLNMKKQMTGRFSVWKR